MSVAAQETPSAMPTGRPAEADHLDLADWRRRVSTLYAEIRAMADPGLARHHWWTVRSQLYRSHPMSPLAVDARSGFIEIPVYAYDPALRFEVVLVPVDGRPERIELGRDGSLVRRPVARTRGLHEALGGELTVWWIEGYGGGLFVPFLDQTCGSETYGGGRYLIDTIKGADLGSRPDGRAILDFNFAYHPSCALNDAYVCPLAPRENALAQPVRGGERLAVET